jgi:hypothetical protein
MATVVPRDKSGTAPVGTGTVEVFASVNTPDFPVAQYIRNPDLSALASVERIYWKIVGDTVVEMDAGEKTSVDAAILPDLKRQKAAVFDAHTMQILEEGVEYPASSGDYYAITPDALFAVQQMRDVGVYPFLIHAINYTNVLSVANLTQANALLATARDKMVEVLQEGAGLLEQIKNAADKAALDAIVDPR